MKQLQPVIWSKGTFLTPQHLQTRDRFVESRLQFQMDGLAFRPWGFFELAINEDALAEGNFAIARATGLFADGLPFEIPDSDPAPAPKPLALFFDADQYSLDVFLAIPEYRDRGVNVSIAQNNADVRYVSEIVNLRDENSGVGEKPVQIARKNLRFLVGGESREGCSALHIARIKRTSAGTLELDLQYIPPLLNIAANGYLMSITRRLLEILAAKSSILAGGRRQRSAGLADFSAADIAKFWLLYTINNHLPALRHIHDTSRGHPAILFRMLSSLAGALTTFSLKIQARDLPLYDHEKLGLCFTNLDETLRELLETVVPSNFVSLPLKPLKPSIFSTNIEDDRYLSGTKLYLAVSSPINAADVIKKAPQLIKLCSAAQIEQLVRMALPGIQLSYAAKPPAPLPVKLNYQYFSLNQAGAAWESVARGRSLAAFVPGDIPEPRVELLILLPQAM